MRSHMRSWLVVAFALAGACAFALAVLNPWWFVGEVTIGPYGAHHCFGGECRGAGLAWLQGSDLWMRSAVATKVAGLVAAFVLVIVGAGVASRRSPRLFARATLVSLATALVCGGYFFAKFPGVEGVAMSFGLPLYIVGLLLGGTAAIAVLRQAR